MRALLVSLLFIVSPSALAQTPPKVAHVKDGAALFKEARVEGTFVLLDLTTNEMKVVGKLDQKGFLPHSTFKIPNTLIGLETGVIPDERFTLTWDGTKYDRKAWEQDTDLPAAMKQSVVWFYQEVARRIGKERMDAWLAKLDYGNRNTSAGIDQFWLRGKMRITPRQQVDFMARLFREQLPVHKKNRDLVLKIIELERTADHVWRGKTGTGFANGQVTAWLVGVVETPAKSYAYAFLARAPGEEAGRVTVLRKALARRFLEHFGVLPAPK